MVLLALNCFTLAICKSQTVNNRSVLNLNYLQYSSEIPKEILSEKTTVFVADLLPSSNGKSSWQSFAKEAHKTFYRLGIDAVAYYNLDLILAGTPVTRSFAGDIKKRGIAFAIILQRGLTTSQDTSYMLTLGRISDQDMFFEAGQPAFRLENNNLNNLMQSLVRAVSSSGSERTNFLVLERPEFFKKTSIFTARRFESYNPDLKLDRLAVPLFEEKVMPTSIPSGMSRDEISAHVSGENQKITEANERLKNIMQQYPFGSGPVNNNQTEAEWRREGYLFALYNIHGKAETVSEILQFNFENEKAPFTSTTMVGNDTITKALLPDQVVYKFYVKHLPTGEVYLGSHWDVDTSWEDALENFINNLKFALKVK